ncbi:hypothetical protein ACLOJK_004358, partial [Asimina triloba]
MILQRVVLEKNRVSVHLMLTSEQLKIDMCYERMGDIDLRDKVIWLLKVQWSNHFEEKAAWELEEIMRTQYPYLWTE